ncbi:hypothetical protein [Nocardia abscessus]|uniref:hypothetical protein n=1 Tax=Nocardia abscessus TaxID=120957 RepID=UPI0024554F18|nr:hypothetical protein [Nocardia abscessus]
MDSLEWVLFFVFLTLKLTGVIDWSWWWVTAPLWIPIVVVGLVGGIGAGIKAVKEQRRKNG